MLRILSAIALAAAVGLTAAPDAGFAKGGATKICRYKTSTGQTKTWRCGKDQPCCASEMLSYYTCGSKMLGCL